MRGHVEQIAVAHFDKEESARALGLEYVGAIQDPEGNIVGFIRARASLRVLDGKLSWWES